MNKLYPQLNQRSFIKSENGIFQKIAAIPLGFILPIMLICVVGIMMMYSAGNGSYTPWATKQIIHLSIAVATMTLIAIIDVRFYYKISYILYFFCLTLLIGVDIFGYKAMGATRWLNLGFIRLQPSDLMKLAMILALARYFHDMKFNNIKKFRHLIIPILLIIIPIILIIRQPDLGTSIILFLLSGGILFVAGVQIWKFMFVAITSAAIIPFAWHYLHDYQKSRIMIFLNPESDPLGAGYNIMQSKIAIGSAGLFGKGFLKGTQSQLSFLPERHTDFIFTMFAEEWGFIGCLILLSLYSYITIYGIKIALNCKNHFGRILAIGSILLFFIHVLINIAMVMGLLPVVGAPLPLLSYGGTIMITVFISFGLVINSFLYRKININRAIKSLL